MRFLMNCEPITFACVLQESIKGRNVMRWSNGDAMLLGYLYIITTFLMHLSKNFLIRLIDVHDDSRLRVDMPATGVEMTLRYTPIERRRSPQTQAPALPGISHDYRQECGRGLIVGPQWTPRTLPRAQAATGGIYNYCRARKNCAIAFGGP